MREREKERKERERERERGCTRCVSAEQILIRLI